VPADHPHQDRPLTGCPECDLLFRLPAMAPGDTALCPRCGYVVTSNVRDGFYRPLIYAATGLMFLAIAMAFPFLSLRSSGMENSMTLPAMITSLTFFGEDVVAGLVLCFVFVIPALILGCITVLCQLLLLERHYRWLPLLARTLFQLNAWAMVEVFAIGVIVSLVKIMHMARVELGMAFWGYLAFALCFLLAMKNLDRLLVWSTIDRLRPLA
jgi:paraquat-inducible protein A